MFALFLLSLVILLTNMWVPYTMGVLYKVGEEKQHMMSYLVSSGRGGLFDFAEGGSVLKLASGEVYQSSTYYGVDYINTRHRAVSIEQAMISTCKSVEKLIVANNCNRTYGNAWKFVSDVAAPGVSGTIASILAGSSTATCLANDFTCLNIGDFGRCLFKNTYVGGNLVSSATFRYTLRDSISTSTLCNTPDIVYLQ